MGVLKTIEKDKVNFLMNFDYNNVLGRLKYVLGKDASFFADVRIRKNDVSWSTKEDIELKPFCDASETEKQSIKTSVDSQIAEYKNKIVEDSLIGDFVQQIMTYPSDLFIYYTQIGGKYKIVLTGWGCKDTKKQLTTLNDDDNSGNDEAECKEEKTSNLITHSSANLKTKASSTTSNQEPNIIDEGFFIDSNKKNHRKKDKQQQSKIAIFKSITLILLAAIIALIIPVFLTGTVNRFVADVTHQWYLNGASRVIITIFVAVVTYTVAYILIRFSTLGKSVVFNVVCFILTFIWSIFMGIVWMPD